MSLLLFSPIVAAVALQPVTGVPWWVAIPLGAVERLLALSEVTAVLWLAWWAGKAAQDSAFPWSTTRRPAG